MLLALVETRPGFAQPVHFDVVRDAAAYRVDATADLAVSPAIVWQTITDYESLPQFMPGIRRVKVLSSGTDGARERLRVEQSGELRVLFYSQRIGVLLDVVHEPRMRVLTSVLPRPGSNEDIGVQSFEATWTLQPSADGVRLDYKARIVPDFSLPPLIGSWLLRRTLHTQYDAMLAEIERRRLAAAGARR